MKTKLYIKMHYKTKLKYFGRTVKQNVLKYLGSGTYWRNHLNKHGNDIVTLRVWEFEDLEECKAFAVKFSIDNNIVNSKAWANQIIETGDYTIIPGTFVGEKNGMFGRKHTDEMKEAQSRRLAETNSRSRWYNNGLITRFTIEPPGPEWKLGRINHNDRRKWFNNGTKQTFALECPIGWSEGQLPFKLKWFNNGIINKRLSKAQEGWKLGMFKSNQGQQLGEPPQ